MATARQTLIALGALIGAGSVSQAPELTQQYRQRLGGALDELAVVVADFDADAARSGMNRLEALQAYERGGTRFFADRGVSMRRTLERFETLSGQARRFEQLPPVARPLVLATGPDRRIFAGAWREFEPALPLTPSGFAWMAVGFAVGASIIWLLAWPFRRRGSRALVARQG